MRRWGQMAGMGSVLAAVLLLPGGTLLLLWALVRKRAQRGHGTDQAETGGHL